MIEIDRPPSRSSVRCIRGTDHACTSETHVKSLVQLKTFPGPVRAFKKTTIDDTKDENKTVTHSLSKDGLQARPSLKELVQARPSLKDSMPASQARQSPKEIGGEKKTVARVGHGTQGQNIHHIFNNPIRKLHLREVPHTRLYLIYTRYPVPFLQEILMNPDFLRVIYNEGHIDTFKHLALLDEKLIKRLNQERWNYMDFRPYMIDIQRNLPSNNKTYNLYIKCPITIAINECIDIIRTKLHLFAKHGVIPDNCWKISTIVRRARSNSMDTSGPVSWRQSKLSPPETGLGSPLDFKGDTKFSKGDQDYNTDSVSTGLGSQGYWRVNKESVTEPQAQTVPCTSSKSRSWNTSPSGSPGTSPPDFTSQTLTGSNFVFYHNIIIEFLHINEKNLSRPATYGVALVRIMLQHDIWDNHRLAINCQWQNANLS